MALTWDWNKKIGELLIRQGKKKFRKGAIDALYLFIVIDKGFVWWYNTK